MIAVHVPIGNRYFDGTDDYVDIGEVAELKLTTYTVTAWFKISSMPSGIEYILGWGTKGFWIYIDGPNKKINIEYMTSTGTSGGTIGYDFWWNNGKWHMVTLYRDQSTGFVRIYLDDNIGVRYTSSASTVYASGERLAIGRKGSSASNYFTGWLRDIRIYDYAVPDEDISNLVYRTSEPTTPPVSQWLLDETSGSTAHDNEGDNDGTFYGGSGSATSYMEFDDIPLSEKVKVKVGSDWKIPRSVFIKAGTWKRVHEPLEIYNPENPERGEPYWMCHDIDQYRTVTFNSDKLTIYHKAAEVAPTNRMTLMGRGPSFYYRNQIDVTNLTTIYIDWEFLRTQNTDNYGTISYGLSTLYGGFASIYKSGLYGFSRRTDSLNVSSATGFYYFMITTVMPNKPSTERTANIFGIWAV